MQRQFDFRPSSYLAGMLVVAHGATVAAFMALDFPVVAKVALTFLIIFSMGYQVRRVAWLSSPDAAVAMLLDGDQVVLYTRDEKQLVGQILGDSLVTPFLTVLNVLPQNARFARSVVIMPDTLDAESFRKLRVWLKWGSKGKL